MFTTKTLIKSYFNGTICFHYLSIHLFTLKFGKLSLVRIKKVEILFSTCIIFIYFTKLTSILHTIYTARSICQNIWLGFRSGSVVRNHKTPWKYTKNKHLFYYEVEINSNTPTPHLMVHSHKQSPEDQTSTQCIHVLYIHNSVLIM